ncbi:MAG: MFS transporter [Betaproteobacteria bacterium]|nr:MFS transporter [Betaproteobacteria bacterium]
MTPTPSRPAGVAGTALAVTLAIQVFTSLAGTATSVLAPEIAPALGLPTKLIGVFVGVLYAGGMAASLASGGFVERYGAIRVSQACVLLCALGLALVAGAGSSPTLAGLVLTTAALIIGLGYGPITPASSQVLARTAPRSRMALTFSLKQTGVPAGAALAGAALPPLALALGWRPTLLLVTALGALVIVAAQPTRRLLDADRLPARPLSVRGVLAPLRAVFASRALAELSLAGFTYAATQVCLMSFLVVYLTETLGRSLVAAGLALTVANLGGIVGRIGWGAIADRRIPPRRLLGLLGILSCLCAVATAAFDARWSPGVLLALCATFGATAIGWNGVQLAELARHAPRGQEGAITGASGFLTLSGVVVGPPTFALLASLTGSYRVGFTVFGIASGLCGAYFLLSGREAMPAAGR